MPSDSSKDNKIDLDSYSTGDCDPGPVLTRCFWLLISRIFFESHIPWSSGIKSSLLRLFGAEIGHGAVLKPCLKIKYPWFLKIGDHCWIGEHAWIDNLVSVTLGDHVVISQGAYLLTGNHDYSSPAFDLRAEPIVIETGAWVAAKAIVCPGVTIHNLAVLCVGSVATKDLEESGVYSGNPATRVRTREIHSRT